MKRFCALILCLILTVSLCCGVASARASSYLSGYNATLFTGNSSGQLRLDFDVTAKVNATEVGVSKIDLYKEDGTYVKSIMGSTKNGLITSGYYHVYSYYFSAPTPGQAYYTKVTLFAKDSTGEDGRIFTTNTATAKS